jgi:hypothetical protein
MHQKDIAAEVDKLENALLAIQATKMRYYFVRVATKGAV